MQAYRTIAGVYELLVTSQCAPSAGHRIPANPLATALTYPLGRLHGQLRPLAPLHRPRRLH